VEDFIEGLLRRENGVMGSLEARRVAERRSDELLASRHRRSIFGGSAWGIRPAQRRRSRLALTLAEREVNFQSITADQSARSIAKLLGRSPSTVSREMSRNGGYNRYERRLRMRMPGRDLVVQKRL